MDFMIQLTWNSTVSILAQIYSLPPHSATYFTAVSEHKNALSACKNIGFYHVLNEKISCGSVAQQKKHIWDYYDKVGQQRYEQGFKLSEVLSALSLTRKHIFAHVLANSNVWKKSIAMYQVLEFMWQVNYFFDKANYYVTYGFELSQDSSLK